MPIQQYQILVDEGEIMTPQDMYREAKEALETGTNMTLVIPKGFKRPPKFPRGELLCENFNGTRCYSYNPQKVLDWLKNMNLTSQ